MTRILFKNITSDTIPLVPNFTPERSYFLYSSFFLKKKREMKHILNTTSCKSDPVLNDVLIRLYNDHKTFLKANLRVQTTLRKRAKKFTLNFAALKKRQFIIRPHELHFLSYNWIPYSTITTRAMRDSYQIKQFRSNLGLVLKQWFFNFYQNLKSFSFKLPSLILYNWRRRLKYRIYYLGFRWFLKKRDLYPLLKKAKSPIIKSPFKTNRLRRKRRKKLYNIRRIKMDIFSTCKIYHISKYYKMCKKNLKKKLYRRNKALLKRNTSFHRLATLKALYRRTKFWMGKFCSQYLRIRYRERFHAYNNKYAPVTKKYQYTWFNLKVGRIYRKLSMFYELERTLYRHKRKKMIRITQPYRINFYSPCSG